LPITFDGIAISHCAIRQLKSALKEIIMSLVGKYENRSTKELLQITEANDANGQMKGVLQFEENGQQVSLDVVGHYHFFQSTGNETSILFTATRDGGPQIYEAWAGAGLRPAYKELNMFGGRGVVTSTSSGTAEPLKGPWVRI
jgi:hypothetical protein